MKKSDQDLFYWCRGQDDNIGDVVLRRVLLNSLSRLGTVHAFVGRASPSFIDGMQFDEDAVLHTSKAGWWGSALKSILAGRGALVFNPGEVRVGPGSAVTHASLIPLQLLGRLRSCPSLRTGVAVRGQSRGWELPLRLSVGLASVNTWREKVSAVRYGGRSSVDWAFADGSFPSDGKVGTGPRDVIALTFRSDRAAWTPPMTTALRAYADTCELKVVVFVQVRRDRDHAKALARALDAQLVDWPDDRTHWQQELVVRTLFARSLMVLSDRIHALIMALTEGAVPIGLVAAGDDKVHRHFAAIGSPDVGATSAELAPLGLLGERVAHVRHALSEDLSLDRARQEVTDVEMLLGKVLTGGGRRGH